MLRKISFVSIALILTFVFSQAGELSIQNGRLVPKLLNYQGYLTDTLSIPIDDTLDMTFKVFDAASSGNELWSETQTNVPIERGVFSVMLGQITPIPDSVFADFTSTWLELTLEGPQTLTPRTRITSVGYAYTSTYSDTSLYAINTVADSDWTISGSNMYSAVSGNVGIGTTTPSAKLNVWNGSISISNGGVYSNYGYWGDALRTNWGSDLTFTSSYADKGILFRTQSGEKMRIDADGNVGIGTTVPAEKLDVAGTAQVTGFKMPTGATNSYVLTSDVSGIGTWQNVSADNDWSFLVSDGADTTLEMDGQWGLSRAGNTLYGNADSTHVNLGVGCVTGTNGQNHKYITVSGGLQNTASDIYTTVGGGSNNTASDNYATVGGGTHNFAGFVSTIGGGWYNTAGNSSTVGGGQLNIATSYGSIGGGIGNTADGYISTVGGGGYNRARGQFSVVGGGGVTSNVSADSNSAIGDYSMIGGGYSNIASGLTTVIGGGYNNDNAGDYSVISGGYADSITATGDYSYLFGINSNLTQDSTFMVDMPHVWFGTEANGYEFPTTDGTNGQALVTDGSGQVSWGSSGDNDWVISSNDMYAGVSGNVGIGISNPLVKLDVNGVICGGVSDTVKGVYGGVLAGYSNLAGDQVGDTAATVVSGWNNSAIADYSFVGGGTNNTASYVNATIVGGDHNTASGHTSFIGGGYNNNASIDYATICGGGFNNASGVVSTVAGGNSNTTSGNYAFIGGGSLNTASGHLSVVAGGQYNATVDSFSFIGSGDKNHIAGKHSAILGGYADTITATGDYSYLFGINSNLTQDSTFMVDMPHVRFGNETNGYEFPTTDGANGQTLVTDGSGQVSWTTKSATTYTPSNSSDDHGGVGDIAWDDDYIYVKTGSGWKRSQLSNW